MDWTANDMPSQKGRRVLITGGNSGLGFHAARALAKSGAEVVLPARSEAKAADAIQRIKADVPHAQLVPAILDVSSLNSVRAFAGFIEERFPGQSIDILINNAGVYGLPKREVTLDGFERQFATNFLGLFALTALLFPHLKPRVGSRIVSLSSTYANQGKIDFDNLQSERKYAGPSGTYAQSKLATLIFALQVQRKLSVANSPIASMAAHPGVATTNVQSNLTGLFKILGAIVTPLIGQNAEQGALSQLYAATSPDAVPGGYYGPNGAGERKGFPAQARLPAAASDAALATRLWDTAERLTGVTFHISSQ